MGCCSGAPSIRACSSGDTWAGPGTIITPSDCNAARRKAAPLHDGKFGNGLFPLSVGSENVSENWPNEAGMLNVALE
jgi:hypothetical protein